MGNLDNFFKKAPFFASNYKIEIILIGLSIITLIISLSIFLISSSNQSEIRFTTEEGKNNEHKISVHIAGAVEKPDLYEIPEGSRLRDLLTKANGLSAEADRDYFETNFNLAQILSDQQKVYIPSTEEVSNRNKNITLENFSYSENTQTSLVNINTASQQQLESLPGIGPVTAKKIINYRPYEKKEILIEEKIIGSSVWEKIKDQISL